MDITARGAAQQGNLSGIASLEKVYISGDDIIDETNEIKGDLKRFGCEWNSKRKMWTINKYTNLDLLCQFINTLNESNHFYDHCLECLQICKTGHSYCDYCLNQV